MVTSLYAGILGLLFVGLSVFTILGRFKHRVSMGDGGNEDMLKRIRLHGNFAEYVPLALILILLTELGNTSSYVVHALGALLVSGRVFHALGLYNVAPINKSRQIGMACTFFVLIIGSIASIWTYF